MLGYLVLQLFAVILCVTAVFSYEQNDYIIHTERAILAKVNINFLKNTKIDYFKLNRTYTALNITLGVTQNLGNDFSTDVQAYKFSSNEYRQFPLRFGRNICDVLNTNEFGLSNFYNCGNFTRCPINKGHYRICNWGPDYSKFPPHIPVGKYKVELIVMHLATEIAVIEWYVKVVSTNPLL